MPTAAPPSVDSAALEEWLARGKDCRVLDVRTSAEFESVHIPGSHNVPVDVLGKHVDEIQRHVDVPVVVVCRSGQRSRQASNTMSAAGMSDVHVLDGGLTAWDDGRRAVVRGRQVWAMERQVRMVAGTLVLTGIVGSLFVPKMKFFAGAIGAGLTFSAVTNTCGMARVLSLLPYNKGTTSDVDSAVRQLTVKGA